MIFTIYFIQDLRDGIESSDDQLKHAQPQLQVQILSEIRRENTQ